MLSTKFVILTPQKFKANHDEIDNIKTALNFNMLSHTINHDWTRNTSLLAFLIVTRACFNVVLRCYYWHNEPLKCVNCGLRALKKYANNFYRTKITPGRYSLFLFSFLLVLPPLIAILASQICTSRQLSLVVIAEVNSSYCSSSNSSNSSSNNNNSNNNNNNNNNDNNSNNKNNGNGENIFRFLLQ